MIKIYRIGHLPNTPFNEQYSQADLEYLKANGITTTTKKKEADIFIAGNHNSLKRFILQNPFKQNYLIWTNEPRFSQVSSSFYYPFKIYPKVHVMNVYTGDVFINNVTYQYNRFPKSNDLNYLGSNVSLSSKKIAALMSFYNGGKSSKIFINGSNIDLIKKRSEIALYGFKIGAVDIFGRGWPEGLPKEDSRMMRRHARKKEILQDYHYNLCFENTIYPKYITEKIWESIENYCLPIYYGGGKSSIYEIFPADSFIDYSRFESPKSLFEFIRVMDEKDYITRMNKCISVYNHLTNRPPIYWKKNKKIMLDNIIKKCKYLIT